MICACAHSPCLFGGTHVRTCFVLNRYSGSHHFRSSLSIPPCLFLSLSYLPISSSLTSLYKHPCRYGINVVPSRNPSAVLFPKQVNIPWANWKCAETGSSWHKWSGPATEHPLPGLTGRIGSALVGYSCSPQETRWSGRMTLRMAVQRCGIDAGCNYIVGVASGQKCLDAAVAAFGNKVTGTRAEAVDFKPLFFRLSL